MTLNFPIVTNNKANGVIKHNNSPALTIQKQVSFGFKPIEEESFIGKALPFIEDNFDSTWQRLVSGVTAILTQPIFDLHNKDADKETRITSCARTISKIVVGTATGVAIRAICIKAFDAFTKNAKTEEHLQGKGKKFKTLEELKNSKWSHCLLTEDAFKTGTYREIKKYRGALGTFAALVIMIFTNFAIDAPGTMKMTNALTPKMLDKFGDKKSKTLEGGANG